MQSTQTQVHSGLLSWLIVLTATTFFFYDFIQLNLFNSIGMQLMQTFNLNAVKLGNLSSLFFYADAFFLIPAGILLDRFSTKKLLLVASACSVLGTFTLAIAPTYLIAAGARFLVGTGGAFCFLGSVRLASRWFPANKMALVTGIIVAQAMLGGLVAQTPMTVLSHLVGWRYAVLIDASVGFLIFLAILFIVRDYPVHSFAAIQANKTQLDSLGFWYSIKAVLLNPYNWFCGVYASLLNLPIFLLGALWGIHYLVQVHHLTAVQASIPPMLFFIGTIIGAPLFGWFSDKIGRRILPLVVGALLSLLVMLALMLTPHLSLVTLICLFFLMGLVICSQVIIYPLVTELNPTSLTATALGFAATIIMWSGAIFQPLFGWAMEWRADHTIVDGVMHYSSTDFLYAMSIMPIAFLVGLLLAIMIKETYCDNYL